MLNNLKPSQRLWAVLPAAGSGSRFSAHTAKQYLSILGQTVMQHSVNRICQLPLAGCVLAIRQDDTVARTLSFEQPELLHWVAGGKERMDSVLSALHYLQDKAAMDDWVLVHDVARPCIQHTALYKLVTTLADDDVGGLLASPVRDTLKRVVDGTVDRTVSREQLWQCQTPQMFRFGVLLNALQQAQQQQILVTDEANAIELLGLPIKVVPASADNIKITYPEDLALATAIMQMQLATDKALAL